MSKRSGDRGPSKCGWCITRDCHNCRVTIEFNGRQWKCGCDHADARPVTEREWLGYDKYTTDVEGMPE